MRFGNIWKVVLSTGLIFGCQAQDAGLTLAPGWQAQILAECRDDRPDMLVFSRDGRYLFQSCETRTNMLAPSLARIDVRTGRRDILLYGLHRADGLKMAPDGSLWIGEETEDGLIWRIPNPTVLSPEQRVDRIRLLSSKQFIRPVLAAGRFSHEGIAFSSDGRFVYLADEWVEGCLYRLRLSDQRLQVLHRDQGWLDITRPHQARLEAERLHGRIFLRLEDMERLPDGSILMAETGITGRPGRILQLQDHAGGPIVREYLKRPHLKRPDNLEWDAQRGWLWITDDTRPSRLWAWDGEQLWQIASHPRADITGVTVGPDGSVYVNLQDRRFGQDLTLRLTGNR